MQQTSRAVLATASVLAAACSTGSDENLGVTRDTLPNGAVSIHYSALPDNSIDSLTPNLTIGAVDGEPHEIFGDIRGVAIDAEGDIYILDYQAAEVRAFNSAGSYLRTLTRKGRGPGELEEANGMLLSSDGTLWIQDHAQWAVIGIGLDGTEVTRFSMPLRMYGYLWDAALDSQGNFVQPRSHSDQAPVFPPEMGVHEGSNRRYMMRFNSSGELLDSMLVGDAPYRSHVARTRGGGYSARQVPMFPRALAIPDPAGGFWATDAASYTVVRVNSQGDTTLLLEADVQAEPVTSADRDLVVNAGLENDPDARASLEELVSVMPAVKPVLDQLVLDDKGNLWVRRFVEQGTSPRYDIFTSNGEYLRSVILAFDAASYFVPTIVDGSVYGLALDTNDVPTVFRAAVPNLP